MHNTCYARINGNKMKQIPILIICLFALSYGQFSIQKEWKYCQINFNYDKTTGDGIIPGPGFKDSMLKAIVKITVLEQSERAKCVDTLTESIFLDNQDYNEEIEFHILCHKNRSAHILINPNQEHAFPDTNKIETAFFEKEWFELFEKRIEAKRLEWAEWTKKQEEKTKK
jgi:hypothetical protein